MLPEKIDLFIDEHVDKPLSEYIKENPRFILEFVNNLSWEEKFELINDFVTENDEINHAVNTLNKYLFLFIEEEIKELLIQNISEEEYLRHKAIVEIYEKAKNEGELNKKGSHVKKKGFKKIDRNWIKIINHLLKWFFYL